MKPLTKNRLIILPLLLAALALGACSNQKVKKTDANAVNSTVTQGPQSGTIGGGWRIQCKQP